MVDNVPSPPPWVFFPHMKWGEMPLPEGWGEYAGAWLSFFRSLSRSARDAYQRDNPEPAGWGHFYFLAGLSQRDPITWRPRILARESES